jgi:hypothetical protein
LLLLTWLIGWIATAPLFHIHIPDNTDRWSALQAGAHTVFTPDLPGEFARPFRDDAQGHVSHLSQRTVYAPELGIALFNNDPRDHKAKPLRFLCAGFFVPHTVLSSWPFERFEPPPPQAFIPQALPASRAPPRIVSA